MLKKSITLLSLLLLVGCYSTPEPETDTAASYEATLSEEQTTTPPEAAAEERESASMPYYLKYDGMYYRGAFSVDLDDFDLETAEYIGETVQEYSRSEAPEVDLSTNFAPEGAKIYRHGDGFVVYYTLGREEYYGLCRIDVIDTPLQPG